MKTLRTLTAILLLALVMLSASSADALETYKFRDTKTFDLGDKPEFDIESISGDVSYEGKSGERSVTVSMLIEVRADDEAEAKEIQDEIDIIVNGRDGYLEARVDRPDNFSRLLRKRYGRDREISVMFIVTGPVGGFGSLSSVSGEVMASNITGPLDASSVSGDVQINDVQKRVEANSVSGQLVAKDCHADVNASTVSGDVSVSNCGGDLGVSSVSGQVVARDVFGTVDASSVSGDVRVTGVGADVSAHTTSGQIDVDNHAGDLRLESVSGDIVARTESTDGILRAESNSGQVHIYANSSKIDRVRLSTFSGQISVDSDLGDDYSVGKLRGSGDLSLTLGRGDLNLQVETHSGDIRIGEL